jgi:hypothetical protein
VLAIVSEPQFQPEILRRVTIVGGTLSTVDGYALWDTCRSPDPSIGVLLNQCRSMARAVQIE